MKLSHESETILSLCWQGNNRSSINFIVGTKNGYITKSGINYIPTEDTYKELLEYQEITDRPFKMVRTGDSVNITGGLIK